MKDNNLVEMVRSDIEDFLKGEHKNLFMNERDFQVCLAEHLKDSAKYNNVFLEYYVPHSFFRKSDNPLKDYMWKTEKLYLDIVVEKGGMYVPVELKYKTKSEECQEWKCFEKVMRGENGEEITLLNNQAAQNIGRYSFWKDVRRVEMVTNCFGKVAGGVAVFLTNDSSYMNVPTANAKYRNFSMSDDSKVDDATITKHILKKWEDPAASIIVGHPDFMIDRNYKTKWKECIYNKDKEKEKRVEIKFYYCIVSTTTEDVFKGE